MLKKRLHLLKSSFFVSSFLTASTIIAFVTQLLLASFFGISIEMDAYFAAIVIPTVVVRLLSGPLQSVFIPQYKQLVEQSGNYQTNSFYVQTFWIMMGLYLCISAIIFFLREPISFLLVSQENLLIQDITADLLIPMSLYTVFLGGYFVTQTLHIAEHSFFIPYASRFLSSCVTLIATYSLLPSQGIFAIAYALVLSSGFECSVSLLTLSKNVFQPLGNWQKSSWLPFIQLFLPLAIGSFIYRSTSIVDRSIASQLGSGAISTIGFSQKIVDSIAIFVAAGLSVVFLAAKSSTVAKKNSTELSDHLHTTVVTVSFIAIPIISFILFFNTGFIAALFERGSFTSETTEQVASTLQWYVGAIFALVIGSQLVNILFSLKKHITIVVINLIIFAGYIPLTFMLSRLYNTQGIAVSYSISTILTIICYGMIVSRYVHIPYKRIVLKLGLYTIASGIMCGFIGIIMIFFTQPTLISLAVSIVVGGSIYFLALMIMKEQMANVLFHYVKKQFT